MDLLALSVAVAASVVVPPEATVAGFAEAGYGNGLAASASANRAYCPTESAPPPARWHPRVQLLQSGPIVRHTESAQSP